MQSLAWPRIASGEHVLVTAPTGTGKTLAAFLVALDRLLTEKWSSGGLRLLYVSPLKALNSDVRQNLLQPLADLQKRFAAAQLCPPQIEVMVRSGDTPETERRRLQRNPPAILITTPESLNILLTQPASMMLFGGLKAVILDEIHAVVGSKRGTALLAALERLVLVAGEFQRIGLSATVNPPELVAKVLGGFRSSGEPRPVTLISSSIQKKYEVKVRLPDRRVESDETGKVFWESLADDLRSRVQDQSPVLIFTNSRRACEKLARLINQGQEELLAYSHHGSLSKEIRLEVEQRLKSGNLKAVVATNSLELGIDVGDLDEVVLAQAPRTASTAIQKVGRAGHGTGQVSRATLYPSHGLDLIEAAIIVRCVRGQTVEPVVVPESPLDVLAQILLSTVCARPTTSDGLYSLVKCSWPYRNLDRRVFDLVVEMLAGRYEGTRIPELKPRMEADHTTGVWSAKSSVPFLLYSSGGTIPNRGYFSLRDVKTGTDLGELDEEFVWERSLGDRFALGAQVWKIVALDDQAVRVESVFSPPHIIPFWKAEDQDRGWFLAEKIALFLTEAEQVLALGTELTAWKTNLVNADGFSQEAADSLVSVLERQRNVLGVLPHRWRNVVERVNPHIHPAEGTPEAEQYIIHTFWGAKLNRPWAFALAQAWEDKFGYALETYAGDDQILVLAPPETDFSEVLSLVTVGNLENLLRRRVEATGFFGARFRESAGRALLLPKSGFDKRTPLWQTRLRSKRLLDAVAQYSDFPILLEAWRQCLHDEFELEALKARLEERSSGQIETWNCSTSTPSPFTEGLLWRQINEKMYAGDEPSAKRPSSLEVTLWDQFLAADRPRLPREMIVDWESRWGRLLPGYAPETPADLLDFLEVRIALSCGEWEALINACQRDAGSLRAEWLNSLDTVLVDGRVGVPSVASLWRSPQPLWLRWLEGRGPTTLVSMAAFWGQSLIELETWAQQESNKGTVVLGMLTKDAETQEICLARTWDQLVRRLRTERRTLVPVRSASRLPLFLAGWQGLVASQRNLRTLEDRVGLLIGLPLDAGLWESVVLPSRIVPYRGPDFDRLFLEGGLRWFGIGEERIVLGFPEDRRLFAAEPSTSDDKASLDQIFGPESQGRESSFGDLVSRSKLATGPLTEQLWKLAWKGLASASSFGPLRQGLKSGFRFQNAPESGRVPTHGFQRWSAARNSSGTWIRWADLGDRAAPNSSSLEGLEDLKRRARLVLDRYGVVFRSLLVHEGPSFQWKILFPALRLMELSGEVVGGLFWEGIPGIQFATPEALRSLAEDVEETAHWVQHGCDPSSLCGLGLETFPDLPRRTTTTWIWWRGNTLVATLTAGGKRLELGTELDESGLAFLVKRTATLFLQEGRTHWTLESIDGAPASDSPQALSLLRAGFQTHGEKLIYWKTK